MAAIIGFVKTVLLTSAIVFTLVSLAVLSVIPVMLLRFWLLPEYLLTVPVDFVAKNIRGHSTMLPDRCMVASIDLGRIPDFSKHDYSLELRLRLPRNQQNLELGNFAIRGALGSQNWLESSELDLAKVDTVERMGIVPFKSSFVELATRYIFSPFYIMEWWSEESQLTIPMWHSAIRPKRKTPYLLLTLPVKLSVSEARLVFEVQLHGVRWLLKQYPIFTTLIGSAITFVCSCAGVAAFGIVVYQKYLHISGPHRLHIDSRSNYLSHPPHPNRIEELCTQKLSRSKPAFSADENIISPQELHLSPPYVNIPHISKGENSRASIRRRKQPSNERKADTVRNNQSLPKNMVSLLELDPGFTLADTFLKLT